jgi:hypothetical protein
MGIADYSQKYKIPAPTTAPVVQSVVNIDTNALVDAIKSCASKPNKPCVYEFTLERDSYGRVEKIIAKPQE